VLWLALVAAMIALGYGSRASSGKPDPQVLYEWSTFVGTVIQDGIVLALVLAIAGWRLDLFALRKPEGGFWRTVRTIAIALAAIYAFEIVYSALLHPGNEQGLTPDRWEPAHAVVYAANAAAICLWVPFVEEMTFRGLGYTLLAPFGRWFAIGAVGLLFGLAHGLIVSLPVIVAFGCVLAWIRSRLNSVIPGMVLHGTFNLIALVAAVTIQR
jgi:membrane protease YdiL (CAAX protease family)